MKHTILVLVLQKKIGSIQAGNVHLVQQDSPGEIPCIRNPEKKQDKPNLKYLSVENFYMWKWKKPSKFSEFQVE